MVEITFKLTPQDLMAVDRYLYRRRFLRFPLLLLAVVVFILTLVPIGTGLSESAEGKPLRPFLFTPFGGLVFIIVAAIIQILIQRLRTVKTTPGLLAPRTFHLGEQGIDVQGAGETSFLRWSAIQRIDTRSQRLFLVLGENLVVVIPQTVSDTPEGRESLFTEIQTLWQQGKTKDANPAGSAPAADSGGLEVRFSFSPEDVAALERFVARRKSVSPLISAIAFGIVGVLATISIAFYFAEDWRNDQTIFRTLVVFIVVFLLTVAVIGGAAAFIEARLRIRRYRSLDKSVPSVFQPRLIRLETEGGFYSDTTGERTVPWKSIHEIAEDEERLYLFLGPRDGCPIPRRAFASPAEMREFIQFARARWRSSRISGDDNPW